MSEDPYKALEDRLGCAFRNRDKLKTALTHSSVGGGVLNYERLEFLGDRVLGLVVAELLYKAWPKDSEGDLAKRHAALVQGSMLAQIARTVDLGAAMIFSDAERAAGGANNDNILADGLEAVIGALYRDGGLEACAPMIARLWDDVVKSMVAPPQDPKTGLQEWAQQRGLPLPTYVIAGRDGPDHAPIFDITVTVEGFPEARAQGPSRRAAEKDAARQLLDRLQKGSS